MTRAPMANNVPAPDCPTVPTPYTGTAGQFAPVTNAARDSEWDTSGTAARKAAVYRHSERDAWGDIIWDTTYLLRCVTVPLSHSLGVGQWDSWRGAENRHSALPGRCPLSRRQTGQIWPFIPFPRRARRRAGTGTHATGTST